MNTAESTPNPDGFSRTMGAFRRLFPFWKMTQRCESPTCAHGRVSWSLWQRRARGMWFQGRWHCSPECLENEVRKTLSGLLSVPETNRRRSHRIPIGLLLLSRGMINDAQLKQALALQRESGTGRIGKFLRQIQAVTEREIMLGLAAQWGCPIYPLERSRDFLRCASLLPLALLEAGRMLPVHQIRIPQTLYLAFVEGVDRTMLYAVEQMVGMRTVPCIVSESALVDALEQVRRFSNSPAVVFESMSEPQEMARTTLSYASQVAAQAVQIARSGRFIWIRLQTPQQSKDILFQIVANVQ